MTKAGNFLNRPAAAASLMLIFTLLSACGSGNSSNSDSSGSNAAANSPAAANAPSASGTPSPSKKMESFTADSLIEALKSNRDEVDKRLSYEEISISGPVKVTDTHNMEFPSKDGGKVNCSLSLDTDKALVQKLYEQSSKGGTLPTTTAIGTYKMSTPPGSGKNWYVGLNQCRIQAAG